MSLTRAGGLAVALLLLGESDDLEKAFEAPRAEAPRADGLPADHNVIQPPQDDAAIAARARFDEQLAAARASIDTGELGPARAAVAALVEPAAQLGPGPRTQASELAFRVAVLAKDEKGAAREAERWLLGCGPDDVDACRQRALASLAAFAPDRAENIRTSDACLKKADLDSTGLPACLDAALSAYLKMKDGLMVARVHLARAKAATSDPRRELEAVERACTEDRCLGLRRRALRERFALELAAGELDAAARAALADAHLAGKPYGRTDEMDRACAALDGRDGKGACRALEKKLHGNLQFRDFSLTQTGEGLSREEIAAVNEHFEVLIRQCLSLEAAGTPRTYQIRWMVLNDGRVDSVHLADKALDDGPLAKCLREQFALWRYPRYEGEWQHVEQAFTVNAPR